MTPLWLGLFRVGMWIGRGFYGPYMADVMSSQECRSGGGYFLMHPVRNVGRVGDLMTLQAVSSLLRNVGQVGLFFNATTEECGRSLPVHLNCCGPMGRGYY